MIVICTQIFTSTIDSADAAELEGYPVYLQKDTEVFSAPASNASALTTVPSGTVLDVVTEADGYYQIYYGTGYGYVRTENTLMGSALDEYVKSNKSMFTKKATIASDTAYMYRPDDTGAFAVAYKGEQFIVTDETGLFVEVSFDDESALLYTADVEMSYYVQVADYRTMTVDVETALSAQIVDYACRFVGNPYVWGGTSLTGGADCSGFVQAVYADFGFELPRCSYEQAVYGTEVSLDELQPGDLVFYNRGTRIGHVAMYVGDGKIVHARNSKYGIVVTDVNYNTPVCARRVLD